MDDADKTFFAVIGFLICVGIIVIAVTQSMHWRDVGIICRDQGYVEATDFKINYKYIDNTTTNTRKAGYNIECDNEVLPGAYDVHLFRVCSEGHYNKWNEYICEDYEMKYTIFKNI